MGDGNNPYSFQLTLAANNRVFDIAPNQYASLAMTLRGDIAFSGKILPRSISYNHNTSTGFLGVELTAIAETIGETYTNGDVPEVPILPPSFPPFPPPPPPPPPPPTLGVVPVRVIYAHTKAGVYYCENINDVGAKVWHSLNGSLTAAESAAIVGIGVHRLGQYVYAVSPAYLFQATWVDGATSQFGLSAVMNQAQVKAMMSYLETDTAIFVSIGVHPYSGEGLFVTEKTVGTPRDHPFFHITTDLTIIPGLANSTNIGASPVISWGDDEAVLGCVGGSGSGGSGVLATTDFGASWNYYPKRSTSGSYYRIARADVSMSIGLSADEAYAVTEKSTDNGHTISDAATTHIPINESASAFSWAANADNTIGLATVKRISGGTYWLASTADGGATWVEIASQASSANLFRAFVHIHDTIWMWGDDTKVYLSMDNGATKTDVTGNLLSDFPGVGGVIDVRMIDFMA